MPARRRLRDIEQGASRVRMVDVLQYLRQDGTTGVSPALSMQLMAVTALLVGFGVSPYAGAYPVEVRLGYPGVLLLNASWTALARGPWAGALSRVAFVWLVTEAFLTLAAPSPNRLFWHVAICSVVLIAMGPLHREVVTYLVASAGVATLLMRHGDAQVLAHPEQTWMLLLLLAALSFGGLTNVLNLLDKVRIHGVNTRLVELAFRDSLTRINNRRAFWAELERRVDDSGQGHPGPPLHLLLIDVDDFKQINDRQGHDVGDEVLKQIASRLQSIVGPAACGRLGGEEFGALVGGSPDEVARLAQQMGAPMGHQAGAQALTVTVSMGIAPWRAGMGPSDLVKAADAALYSAKRAGKNQFRFAG